VVDAIPMRQPAKTKGGYGLNVDFMGWGGSEAVFSRKFMATTKRIFSSILVDFARRN